MQRLNLDAVGSSRSRLTAPALETSILDGAARGDRGDADGIPILNALTPR